MVFEVVSAKDRAAKLMQKVRLFLRTSRRAGGLANYRATRDAYVYKAGSAVVVHEEHAVRNDLLPGVEIPFDQFPGSRTAARDYCGLSVESRSWQFHNRALLLTSFSMALLRRALSLVW